MKGENTKKFFTIFTLSVAFAACDGTPNFATNLDQATEYINSDACQIIATGQSGDTLLKCAPNAVFNEAFAADKTANIESVASGIEQIDAMLTDTEYVYVNVVQDDTCPISVLIPGSNTDEFYASQICDSEKLAVLLEQLNSK